ncbi:MAG: LysM peptidoglycan-binding domain-containing protein [Spirochaetota bacterium]
MQRSGLPLMILAGVLLALAVAIVLLVANPFSPADDSAPEPIEEEVSGQADAQDEDPQAVIEPLDDPAEAESEPEPATEPEAEPEPEPAADPDVQPASDQTTIPASAWRVRSGDSLYEIAGEVWSDPFLWPLLLQANDERIEDPDYLRPGQTVEIPAWVTVASGLTSEQRRRLSASHVLAYRHYLALGDDAIGLGMGQPEWWRERLGRVRLNKAHWVLYSGLRYDPDLLSTFASDIRDEDIAEVRGYRERFGLPPNRR